MSNTYDIGEKVKITGTFTLNNELADPAIVRAIYKDPSGTTVSMLYPEDSRITRVSSGVYFFEIATSVPGLWHYRMDDGGVNVGTEGKFQVKLSELIKE